MKSITPLSAITVLAALALGGCSQSSPSNAGNATHDSRVSDTNSMMRGSTNMPANTQTTSAANDAKR